MNRLRVLRESGFPIASGIMPPVSTIMARKKQKKSNRFDDYEESYDEDDFEYDDDKDCDDYDADNDSDEYERATHQRRKLHQDHGRHTPMARSVGGRESTSRRKKAPVPALVRPPVKKPDHTARETRREHRTTFREREQPQHGPHFLDSPRSRPPEPVRASAARDQYSDHDNKPAKTGTSWGRFLLLLVLLACGTAYTFYATTNNFLPEGSVLNTPQSESDADLPNNTAEDQTNAETEDSATQSTARVFLPGGITQESWVPPESQPQVASGLSREFQHLSYDAESAPSE